MDRRAWLAERRAAVEAGYDAEAPTTMPRRVSRDIARRRSSAGCSKRVRPTGPCSMPRAGPGGTSRSCASRAAAWSAPTSQPACSPRRRRRDRVQAGARRAPGARVRRRVRRRHDHRRDGERPSGGMAAGVGESAPGGPSRWSPVPHGRGGRRRRGSTPASPSPRSTGCRPSAARSSRATRPATTTTPSRDQVHGLVRRRRARGRRGGATTRRMAGATATGCCGTAVPS